MERTTPEVESSLEGLAGPKSSRAFEEPFEHGAHVHRSERPKSCVQAPPMPPKIEDRLRALQLPLAQVHIKERGSMSPEHLDALRVALERLEIPAAFWLENEKGDHLHGLVDRDSVATVVELYRDLAGDHPRGDHWIFHATEKGAAPCAVVLTLDFVQTPTAPIEKFTGYLSKQGLTLVIDTLSRDPSRNSPPPRGMDQ